MFDWIIIAALLAGATCGMYLLVLFAWRSGAASVSGAVAGIAADASRTYEQIIMEKDKQLQARDDRIAELTGIVVNGYDCSAKTAADFESWWRDEGQYVRAGGGDYEKSFAGAAFRYWSERVRLPNTADEAQLMANVGIAYLQEHAPERLTEEGRSWMKAATVPDGWKPVPVELTDEMFAAADVHLSMIAKGRIYAAWDDMLAAAPQPPTAKRECKDGGTCHHQCADGECFREKTCSPLSGSGLGADWKPVAEPKP